jgi:hypothetical protein
MDRNVDVADFFTELTTAAAARSNDNGPSPLPSLRPLSEAWRERVCGTPRSGTSRSRFRSVRRTTAPLARAGDGGAGASGRSASGTTSKRWNLATRAKAGQQSAMRRSARRVLAQRHPVRVERVDRVFLADSVLADAIHARLRDVRGHGRERDRRARVAIRDRGVARDLREDRKRGGHPRFEWLRRQRRRGRAGLEHAHETQERPVHEVRLDDIEESVAACAVVSREAWLQTEAEQLMRKVFGDFRVPGSLFRVCYQVHTRINLPYLYYHNRLGDHGEYC